MLFVTHEARVLQWWPRAVENHTWPRASTVFMFTSRGRCYVFGGAAAFSDKWEQDVSLGYRSR